MKRDISRRQFMKRAAILGGGVALSGPIASILAACGGAAPAAPAQPVAPQPAAPAAAAPAPSGMAPQAPAQPAAPAPAMAAAPAAAAQAPAMMAKEVTGPVRWLTWSTYDHPPSTKLFEQQYGVTIQLNAFGPNEEAFGKLKAAGTGAYDNVGMDGLWCQEYYRQGLTEATSYDEYESSKTLFPEFLTYVDWLEPGDTGKMLAYPSAASPNMIAYNTKYVDPPPKGYLDLLDPKWKGHVALNDNFKRGFIAFASAMGYEDFEIKTPEGSRWDLPPDVLQATLDEMLKAKDNFVALWRGSGELGRLLASEEIWISDSPVYGGLRARDAGNPDIRMVFPNHRTIGWIDGHMVVKNAKHREGAIRWIDHYYNPENSASFMQKSWLPMTNKAGIDIMVANGFGEEIEVLQSYKMGEWVGGFSQFQPVASPEPFNNAWAEFLSA